MRSPRYSIVVPVYNRPQEVDELLASLATQTFRDFEVIVVEDGSTLRCDTVVDAYRDKLVLHYFFKPNSGPGPSRNFGYAKAAGEYFIVFDSDCIIPPDYLVSVEKALQENGWDAWGGPDRAHANFTPVQRAMGYTMASVLTTGGIRGGKKHVGAFQPRSFNMGISRKVFEATQGFKLDRFAEDIEFSIRMRNMGFRVALIPEAFVYHKRRTSFGQFYHQVSNFGKGRIQIGRVHRGGVKLAHWFPAVFLLGTGVLLFLPLVSWPLFVLAFAGFVVYLLAIFVDSLRVNKDVTVALLSVPAALLQLWGYGLGFLKEKFKTIH
ncbi:glycosyltransferase [Chryseolinea lacunae]|uniref:Glycosyltransferase n=1 Tax=Chryseolinea lacunae TaxID=2801331 RepID=A0ABS1L0C1_9BACT|nr:glycosyltransferase [Chryseolinea lacunae]MBL0745155.1 glycosyltransferase [Chryseolinea lacunae]